MDSDVIFRRVTTLSGLSTFIGPGTIRRALEDVGASPSSASLATWRTAILRIEARMRAYMPKEEVVRRVQAISSYLDQQSPVSMTAGEATIR
jgi:hypothetical protein